MFVEQLHRQPVGVGPHPSDRPENGVGRRGRLSGAPLDWFVGDLIAREPVGYHCAVTGVEHHSDFAEALLDTFPCPRVMLEEGALAREIEVDSL
jgi:hypothetical protein